VGKKEVKMEPLVLKPEKEQRTMWFIGWAIPFVLGLALWVVLLLAVDKLIFSLCVVGWLILMSPILLWIPAFYKSLEYIIDRDSVRISKGVFWRKRVIVPYTKITNIDVTQGPIQRTFNIGTIHVQTAGAGGTPGAQAELKLLGIRDTDGLKDTIMERVRGHNTSAPEEAKKKVVQESDSEILRHMLKELTAIHEVLEKRQS
jgi:membrane protein YdbS with pleckstrin-like domain